MSIDVKDVALEKRHERLAGFLDLERIWFSPHCLGAHTPEFSFV